jgi:hypothetical protein
VSITRLRFFTSQTYLITAIKENNSNNMIINIIIAYGTILNRRCKRVMNDKGSDTLSHRHRIPYTPCG